MDIGTLLAQAERAASRAGRACPQAASAGGVGAAGASRSAPWRAVSVVTAIARRPPSQPWGAQPLSAQRHLLAPCRLTDRRSASWRARPARGTLETAEPQVEELAAALELLLVRPGEPARRALLTLVERARRPQRRPERVLSIQGRPTPASLAISRLERPASIADVKSSAIAAWASASALWAARSRSPCACSSAFNDSRSGDTIEASLCRPPCGNVVTT